VRALKALTVVMGVMILVGVAVLIAVIAGRLTRAGRPGEAAPYMAAPIDLPRGARIEMMAAGADRLVLDLILPEGGRQLLILDLATGRRIGTIDLRNGP